MITDFSPSPSSSLLAPHSTESQWSQMTSGIWVPKTPSHAPLQSCPPQQAKAEPALEKTDPKLPASTDRKGWQRYWVDRGWTWRREPEIRLVRQRELAERRALQVDLKAGIYPFASMTLARADIEWLLATHDGGVGPVDWHNAEEQARKGLDLRGAVVLAGTNLRGLPLARLRGCLLPGERQVLTEQQSLKARLCLKGVHLRKVHLEGADLREAHLEGVDLRGAYLEGADLRGAHLERADLRGAHLEGAHLSSAYLQEASLSGVHLQGADLWGVHLEEASLREAHLEGANLIGAYLQGTHLVGAHLEGAYLSRAHLEKADLRGAHLEEAHLREAHLEGSGLREAHLGGADLREAHLEGADLREAHLEGANLREAHLERALLIAAHLEGTDLSHAWLAGLDLTGATLADATGVGPALVDVRWAEANLSVVGWSPVRLLGDENQARQSIAADGQSIASAQRRSDYQDAHRANHQLAMILQSQGLVEDATRFAYRAKCLKQTVLWYDLLLAQTIKERLQVSGSLLFSWALFLLAGYGYRLRRCVFSYVGIVLTFMLLYWHLDPAQFPWWAALGESINVFHGSGAAPSVAQLAHPVRFTLLTVIEALTGLVIEIVFVATVIQRLFGK